MTPKSYTRAVTLARVGSNGGGGGAPGTRRAGGVLENGPLST